MLVLQSGGPTAVINASLVGVVLGARRSRRIGSILGSRRGVEGILAGEFFDLTSLPDGRLARLRRTPSAALGTSRRRPSDSDLAQIVHTLSEREIQIVVAIGGNDTADTLARLGDLAADRAISTRFVVVPKTIDNDLPDTDHCPGYGSIARFTALAVRESALDTEAMAGIYPIKIVEVMGRNAGWLAASASLLFGWNVPRPLLCLPERPIEGIGDLVDRVRRRVDEHGYAIVVAPETMHWADGKSAGGDTPIWVDEFGHPYFPGVGDALARSLSSELGLRTRFDKPGTVARMAMHAVSNVDLLEAEEVGVAAVERALAGESGIMITIERTGDAPYTVRYGATALQRVANTERLMPDEMIASSGDDITSAFLEYALPLLGDPIDPFESLSELQPG